MQKTYRVQRAYSKVEIDSKWDIGSWLDVKSVSIKHRMGNEPAHKPVAHVKAVYDDEAIYINFRVEDKYVRAVAKGYHSNVWEDSCAEFFFTPSEDISQGYFNVETNCGGAMLFNHQKVRGVEVIKIADEDCDKVTIYHSLPEIVEPELSIETVWSLQYRLPFDIIEKYAPTFVKPLPGVRWLGNFYKCGDATSHPHWLTWNRIDYPEPNFHVPEFFGVLEFD